MAFTFVTASALAGCAAAPRPAERPRVEVLTVDYADEAVLIELSVANPNRTALGLEAVDWEIRGGDAVLARGRLDLSGSLKAMATTPVTLNPPVGAVAQDKLRAAGKTPLTATGVLHLRSSAGPVAAPF